MNKRPSKSEEIGQTEMCCTTTGNNVNKGTVIDDDCNIDNDDAESMEQSKRLPTYTHARTHHIQSIAKSTEN
ncbi:unnamed protein product [Ceratitis capitata]|uniref:(Mediterranean fruit fly) hypothetical protein n=1 Tax=Ceratitis capitata TaxID=7213 RepID=A0A811ULR1_CERCA|nr:unnamed protein product [Ceratitis capitata]